MYIRKHDFSKNSVSNYITINKNKDFEKRLITIV